MKTPLGKWKVDPQLLARYVELWTQAAVDVALSILRSSEMQAVHLALRESVGLEGYWSYPTDEFDTVLSRYAIEECHKDKRWIEYVRVARAELHRKDKSR